MPPHHTQPSRRLIHMCVRVAPFSHNELLKLKFSLQDLGVQHLSFLLLPRMLVLCLLGYFHLALGQGDTGKGERGEKKIHHPPTCLLPNKKKNKNWKTTSKVRPNTRTLAICWCFLLHTVFAKLPLTACISNETLCPCGEGSKSVPVRAETISPVWLFVRFSFPFSLTNTRPNE